MIGQTRLQNALSAIVKRAKVEHVSLCAQASTRQVFRFAHGSIHQDVFQEQLSVKATVIDGKRLGVASTDSLSSANLIACLEAARAIASHAPKMERPFAWAERAAIRFSDDYDAATAKLSPKTAIELLAQQMRRCQGAAAELAGSFVTGEDELAVVNSLGLSNYAAASIAAMKCVTFHRGLSGFSSAAARTLEALDPDAVLARSLEQCLHATAAVRLPLGIYEVILGPEAIAEILEWLGLIAFGAKAFQEHTSFLTGRMDERVMDPQISIYDDAMESGMLRRPFDFEGSPTRRVLLIDRGTANSIVYDATYGARYGQASTGHALPPGDTEGPLPLHLAIAPGNTSVEDMIRSCARGLFIPRLHYVNGLLNPREALMTGLTREGAFLIERGRFSAPIATLRFTHSITDAFSHVLGVSRKRRLVADPHTGLGCALAPYIHLEKLTFTGGSES